MVFKDIKYNENNIKKIVKDFVIKNTNQIILSNNDIDLNFIKNKLIFKKVYNFDIMGEYYTKKHQTHISMDLKMINYFGEIDIIFRFDYNIITKEWV